MEMKTFSYENELITLKEIQRQDPTLKITAEKFKRIYAIS